ncbi:hypothetical protein [Photobacterium profundum]|uniref:hypothetical protein n=1 Tax=Photobacterium profundum TaxID=74109 RepID=UPI003D09BE4D
MKKAILATAILATTVIAGTSAFAAEGDSTVPARTTVHWAGKITDVIPGDNIIITGEGGKTEIATGDLRLQADGTFDSTPIVLETRAYDETKSEIGDITPAKWTLESVSYVWGTNQVGSADIQVFDLLGDPATPLVKGAASATDLSSMKLVVKNTEKMDLADLKDKTATAQLDVTMTAQFKA